MAWSRVVRGGCAAAFLVSLAVGVSCGDDLDQPSVIKTLRIVAITADQSHPAPGQEVTLRMTYADAVSPDPRPIQITWFAGCVEPPGGSYYGCYPEIVEAVRAMAAGEPTDAARIRQEVVSSEWSGVPDAVPFTWTIPDDVLSAGAASATAFVFFTACAGELRPASQGGDGPASFPLACVDAAGTELGADSFVPGFAELFVFRDGRANTNPPVEGITVGSVLVESDPAAAPIVTLCPEREEQGCTPAPNAGQQQPPPCATYRIQALVPDVAELIPSATGAQGEALREIVWVNYYADGGEFDRNEALVSDAALGYQDSFDAKWTPPAEPGLVTLWAVAHDSRGGAAVRRAFLRVE